MFNSILIYFNYGAERLSQELLDANIPSSLSAKEFFTSLLHNCGKKHDTWHL